MNFKWHIILKKQKKNGKINGKKKEHLMLAMITQRKNGMD